MLHVIQNDLRKAAACIGLGLISFIVVSCEMIEKPAPVEVEASVIESEPNAAEPISQSPQIELEPEGYYGPRPVAKPSVHVESAGIPPASQDAIDSATTVYVQRDYPETGDLEGVTQAHSSLLQSNGMRGVIWSDSLANRANLQVQQVSTGLCNMTENSVLHARGEAIYIAPAGRDSQAQPREARVSVKRFVERLAFEKAGPFGSNDRGAATMGCAISKCPNHQQVWLCRYE